MGIEESRKPWKEREEDDKPVQEGGRAGGISARNSCSVVESSWRQQVPGEERIAMGG